MVDTRALKNPGFKNLWLGQAISQFGDSLYFLLFFFMVNKITGDPKVVGYIVAMQGIIFMIFGFTAGAVVDRFDRRTILLISDIGSAAVLVAFGIVITMQARPPIWSMFVVYGLLSFLQVFFMPAKSACIPRLVPDEDLIAANALSTTTQMLMPFIGLAISGLALGPIEAYAPNSFFIIATALNAISFLASAYFVRKLPPVVPERSESPKSPLRDVVDGGTYVARNATLLTLTLLGFGMNMFISPFFLVYVAANDHWFGGHYWSFAMFEGSFILMMMIGSILVPRVKIEFPGRIFIGTMVVVGLAVAAMGLGRNIWVFTALNMACGIILPFGNIPIQTLVQRIVPDEVMGRVSSIFSMSSMIAMPLSNYLAGVMLGYIHEANLFFIMGLGLSVVGVMGAASRSFLNCRLPEVAVKGEPGMVGGEGLEPPTSSV